ncbi:MAG: hypothetical protein KBI47_16335 [Armatimonadetes bacterium]|jgi:hypothetical protein|nr:hypothetical protein [Armatimonadota bacterium]MDI9582930.1 hypothetical protein [Acidobacteriota bacterium]
MDKLSTSQTTDLRDALSRGLPMIEGVPRHIGGKSIEEGLWRFFSPNHPACGIRRWNEEWSSAWGVANDGVFTFGEDVFGNQLLFTPARTTVLLCDHENGACYDLELGVLDLLEAAVEHGLSWIDFYSNGALSVGRGFLPQVNWEQHLHWTRPLILGGAVTAENTAVVDRFTHLHGHAKLWRQVSDLPPGTEVQVQ